MDRQPGDSSLVSNLNWKELDLSPWKSHIFMWAMYFQGGIRCGWMKALPPCSLFGGWKDKATLELSGNSSSRACKQPWTRTNWLPSWMRGQLSQTIRSQMAKKHSRTLIGSYMNEGPASWLVCSKTSINLWNSPAKVKMAHHQSLADDNLNLTKLLSLDFSSSFLQQ